jgi:glycerophosphoryl diester phosphodiesterase
MIILAHRANVRGPCPPSENSLAATLRALELGFGIETDLRRDSNGEFYVAHDSQPRTPENGFTKFALLFRKFADQVVAMNVKELGCERELIALHQSGDLGARAFYFDFGRPRIGASSQNRHRTDGGGRHRVALQRVEPGVEPFWRGRKSPPITGRTARCTASAPRRTWGCF